MKTHRILLTYLKQTFIKWKLRSKLVTGENVIITNDFQCGLGCRINDNSQIGPQTIFGNNVKIGNQCFINKAYVGENSRIDSFVVFSGDGNGKLIMGRESYIGLYNVLDLSSDITIGNYVHVAGPSTGLWTHSSYLMCLNSVKISESTADNRPTAPITIEDNVYIGGNCTIYPGVRIGHHSIVAPNSAVTKDVPPYSMVGGVPAKFIKDTKGFINKTDVE